MVLRDCLQQARSFFGDGESGAVPHEFSIALAEAWTSHLHGILDAPDEATGTAVAVALAETLTALHNSGLT